MPKIVDRDTQREEILLATLRTIASHGFAGATVRRIAEEAQVSTGFITHYFKDKNEVLAGALRLSNERSSQRVEDRVRDQHGLDGLRALVDAVLPLDEDRRIEWRIWLTFWGQSGRGALDREKGRGRALWRSEARRLLGEACDMGEIRDDLDLDHEAGRIVILVSGIGLQSPRRAEAAFAKKAAIYIEDHLTELARGAP